MIGPWWLLIGGMALILGPASIGVLAFALAAMRPTEPPGTTVAHCGSPSASAEAPDDPLARLRLWNDMQLEARRLWTNNPWNGRYVGRVEPQTVRIRRRVAGSTLRLNRSRRAKADRPAPSRWPLVAPFDRQQPIVMVLGPAAVAAVGQPATTQQTALLTLLLARGPQGKDRLIDALWDGQTVSDSRFANLLSDTRRLVGKNRLVHGTDGRYQLSDVGYDLAQFNDLVRVATEASNLSAENSAWDSSETTSAAGHLINALSLVRGPLFDRNGSKFWRWLDNDYHLQAEAEEVVVSAALRLAELAAENQDPARRIWACQQGLMVVPFDERLLGCLARCYDEQGQTRVARRLREGALSAETPSGW